MKPSWNPRHFVYNVVSALLLIAGCICLILGLLAATQWNITPALSLLGAALALFFSGTVERFESLKGLGMEAKLATLDIKIGEASRLLDQIKMVAEITGKASLSMYARTGRISGPPSHEEMYELIQKVIASLVSIGSSSATIKEAIDPCTFIMQHDMTRAITKSIVKDIQDKQHELRNSAATSQALDQESNRSDEIQMLENLRLDLLHGKGSELSSYPASLINLLESGPASEFSSAAHAAKDLREFAAEMEMLRQTGKLAEPAKWFEKAKTAYT